MALTEITDATFQSEVSTGIVLVDCWAEWCGPCRMVTPILEELSKDYSGRVEFKKLDVDANQSTTQSLNIQSIPTLLLYKNGQLVDKVVGALPKAQLKSFIERHV